MKISVPGCMSLAVHDRRWFVLRIWSGSEDDIFLKLLDAGYEAYLPRSRTDKFNRRVRVIAEKTASLMPGYLFVVHPRQNQPIDDWREVRDIRGVIEPLKTQEGPLLIPCPVVEAIMSMEFESTYDDTRAAKQMRGETNHRALKNKFRPGRLFMIKDGPFSSFMAKVESLTAEDRIKGLLDIFGRFVSVEFDPDQLEEPSANMKPNAA